LFRGIRNYPHRVWETFVGFPSGKDAYYKTRDEEYEDESLYYRAARTLYLNRTCFKGMWRHSPSGNFNVGYGGEERRWVITHDSVVELPKRLRKATLVHMISDTFLSVRGAFPLRRCGERSDEAIYAQLAEAPP